MKVYCGDYKNCRPPRLFHWGRLGIIAACLLFTSAATPAMINYYWNGQNSRDTLELNEAIRMAQDSQVPEAMRKSSQGVIFIQAKRAIQGLIESDQSTTALADTSRQLLRKLKTKIEESQ